MKFAKNQYKGYDDETVDVFDYKALREKQSSDEQGGVSGAHGVDDAMVIVLRAD